jgi:hypothetical protein
VPAHARSSGHVEGTAGETRPPYRRRSVPPAHVRLRPIILAMACLAGKPDRGRRPAPPAPRATLPHVSHRRWTPANVARTILTMARVQYESKDDAGHKFWTARYGRYAIRIDANRAGVYRWLVTLEGRSVRKGVASDRAEAHAAVSDALDELPR